ncbi:hypothetical protein HBI40_118520 [Parastagonospora nodorum]|nr:hypothetical protein HBH50_156510 [Parastagonospora nodorum]KAH4087546.1 hypothetical protein HBH48_133680 [Parastagonospora nodorum]KAH4117460.1 hypothetical protein HBH47_152510 [Parastagonospora nodorum]KAH4172577.1 hypothetical protein HBH43_091770 [Parastagonospora nodorum]KAH5307561.1 hypothetical protein HBI11_109050 [Parastagonospora nodorum]
MVSGIFCFFAFCLRSFFGCGWEGCGCGRHTMWVSGEAVRGVGELQVCGPTRQEAG